MKTLIEAVEAWIDSKVESNIRPWLTDMEDIHIRDANRISELESKLRTQFQNIDTLNMQVQELLEDKSAEAFVEANDISISTLAERIDTLETEVEETKDQAEEAFSLGDTANDLANDLEERVDTLEGAENNEAVIEDMVDRQVNTAVRNLTFNISVE